MQTLFDQWATTYDRAVKETEAQDRYPFAGYTDIKRTIFNTTLAQGVKEILEMGIGTGTISKALYESGHAITGVDLSKNMIQVAQERLPDAKLHHAAFETFTKTLTTEVYDVVIFSYSIHHLTYEAQTRLLLKLKEYLSHEGLILIGDVMAKDAQTLSRLKARYASAWDTEEHYPLVSHYKNGDITRYFSVEYQPLSHCSGVITLKKHGQ